MGAFASALAALAAASAVSPALASGPCKGPPAKVGQVLHGAVLYVPDGRRLCLAARPDPESWTEVELQPETPWPAALPASALSRAALMSVAFAKTADCTVVAAADGRPVARCQIEGAPVEALLAEPGALERARAWLPKIAPGQALLASAGR
jgi:hypothetical protein